MTGSAVVGHDTNTAASESITNTTNSTIALVVLILLVVYRSPLLAMVPLVTIALSVFVSLHLIALLTWVPGLGFPGDQHHQGFRRRCSLRRGNGLLPVPDRAVLRGAASRPVEAGCSAGSDRPGRGGTGGQRRHGHRRAWDALFLEFRQGQVHRADDRALAGGRAARRIDLGPGHAGPACAGRSSGRSVHPIDPPARLANSPRPRCAAIDGFLGAGRRPRGQLSRSRSFRSACSCSRRWPWSGLERGRITTSSATSTRIGSA